MDYRPYILAGMLLLVLVAFVIFVVVLIRSRRAPMSHVSFEHHDASIQPTRPLDTSLEGLEVIIDEDAPSAALLTPLRTGEWMPPDRPAPAESLPSVSLTERVAEYHPAPDIREPAFTVETTPSWMSPTHGSPTDTPSAPSAPSAPVGPSARRTPEAPAPDVEPSGPVDDDLTEQIAALLPTVEPSGEAGAEPEFDLDTLVRSLSDDGASARAEGSTTAVAPESAAATSASPSDAVGEAEPYAEMPPTPVWTPPVPQPQEPDKREPEVFISEVPAEEPGVERLSAEPPLPTESHPAEEDLSRGFGAETVSPTPALPSDELEPPSDLGRAVAFTQMEPQAETVPLAPASEPLVPAETPAVPAAPAETHQAEPEIAEPEPEWIDMMREQQGASAPAKPKPAVIAAPAAPRPAATVNPAPITSPKPVVQAPAQERRARPQVKVHRAEEAEAAAGAGGRRIAPLRVSGSTGASDRRSGPIPDIVMEAPVEMWFGDSRVGVKAGTATYERFRKYADVLFADLKASEHQSR